MPLPWAVYFSGPSRSRISGAPMSQGVDEMRPLGVLRIMFGIYEEFGEARCLINTLGFALYGKQTC